MDGRLRGACSQNVRYHCGLDSVLRAEDPQLGSPFPSTWGIVWPSLPAPPTCTQVCLYLVAEISDLQGIGLATGGEVQAVVTFRGEHAVLEALPGDMTGEGLLQKEEDIGENRERRPREVRAGASVGEIPSGQEMDLQEEPKGSEKTGASMRAGLRFPAERALGLPSSTASGPREAQPQAAGS